MNNFCVKKVHIFQRLICHFIKCSIYNANFYSINTRQRGDSFDNQENFRGPCFDLL